ncbi:MAG: FAD binding domain-containing protein [Thermotogota bacterium]|nr:FAD binding domain-containing protein [Thermotogota bacterium]
MLTNLKEYLKPNSLKEAWGIYLKDPEHTLFSTGGLSTALREDERTQIVLDLKGLLPNQLEDKEDHIFIGGNMTINEVLNELGNHDLSQVLKQVATHQIRNMASISGSIAQKYGWSDIITALVAYKADVLLYTDKGQTNLPIEEYLSSKVPSIVLGVSIKKAYKFGSFHYISRTDYDVSQFNFYLCACVENGRILEAGISYGARPGYAKSFVEVEEMLKGLAVNELVGKTDKILGRVENAKVSTGFGLSQEYRQELLKVYLKRTFKVLSETS